ncbi:hypothetical protein FRB94_003826 [Tulasnella sp. JGI-2019a]|nr:hypothetical protein FRB94_003826 [Tulasnella sp. JGI-2019a]
MNKIQMSSKGETSDLTNATDALSKPRCDEHDDLKNDLSAPVNTTVIWAKSINPHLEFVNDQCRDKDNPALVEGKPPGPSDEVSPVIGTGATAAVQRMGPEEDKCGKGSSDEIISNSAGDTTVLGLEEALDEGNDALDRFEAFQRHDDLDLCIERFEKALALCPIDHLLRVETLFDLCAALQFRFQRDNDTADLENIIRHLQETLALVPIGHPLRQSSLAALGAAFDTMFKQKRDLADLEETIRYQKDTLSLCPIGHSNRSGTLDDLGTALLTRFDQTDNMADLKEGINCFRDALSLRPIGHAARESTLDNLGKALSRRFEYTGSEADLEESICHHQVVLSLCPIGHPGRSVTLNNLGSRLMTQFDKIGNMADLRESIHHLQEALSLRPMGHPLRWTTLSNLGNGLRTQFDQMGEMVDLEESILHYQEAVVLHPTDHPGRSLVLNNLGFGLKTRFNQAGNMADLNESILYLQEALSLGVIGHSIRSAILNNLGIALSTRFERMGNMADLEESIHHYQEALPLYPIGHPDRSPTLNNLGIALGKRFDRMGNMVDLEESIHYHREALSNCPTRHPHRSTTLTTLGNRMRGRFDQTGSIADFEESIHCHQEALTLRPIGHPDRSVALNHLGMALSKRFSQTGNVADLEESIRYHQEDLFLCPIGHPGRSATLHSLGSRLSIRYDLTGNMVDLEESIRYHMDSVNRQLSPLSSRLTSAHNWIVLARKHSLDSLEDAYAAYMDLLHRSLFLGASSIHDTHSHMTHINKTATAVTEDATSHALEKHQLSTAVEIAERGRALLFTKLGNYRTTFKDLEFFDKGLADRFRTLSTELEDSFTLSSGDARNKPGDQVARRQKMAAEWDHVVEEIRQLKSLENFLGVTPFATLQNAAVDGPVILVNISRYGSFAVIIKALGDPLSVPLPEATPSAIATLAVGVINCTSNHPEELKSNKSLIEIMQDLWVIIVAPIVLQLETTLGLQSSLAFGGCRRRWLGGFRFTQQDRTSQSRAGYRPTENMSGPRMLVVAQAEAEGQAALPCVEAEVALIRRLQARVTVVEGEDCTREYVLAGLKDTAWIHFSCHGHQHPTEPFKSHFSVGTFDAPLTVLDIIRNGLPRAELAVLSACHSAAGEKTAPDGTINLAAGMLFAGFRSVVGTMWAMDDRDGPIMAQEFYKYIFRNGPEAVDCRDAAKALVMAVRGLRRREVPLGRWINFVHYGI